MSEQEVVSAGSASLVPADQAVAESAAPIESRRPRAADPRPLISDEDEYMVESFVTGLLTCPAKYHDCFIDSWIDSHPAGRSLLLAAYMIVDLVESFHKVGYARPEQERA